ncbi:MAG: hypothetical protein JTT14_00970, partial [Candidatus Brockarchaeota archaeon]|nr:hypothetical protein [Candidatus Brockarchaeota archaeon]
MSKIREIASSEKPRFYTYRNPWTGERHRWHTYLWKGVVRAIEEDDPFRFLGVEGLIELLPERLYPIWIKAKQYASPTQQDLETWEKPYKAGYTQTQISLMTGWNEKIRKWLKKMGIPTIKLRGYDRVLFLEKSLK